MHSQYKFFKESRSDVRLKSRNAKDSHREERRRRTRRRRRRRRRRERQRDRRERRENEEERHGLCVRYEARWGGRSFNAE